MKKKAMVLFVILPLFMLCADNFNDYYTRGMEAFRNNNYREAMLQFDLALEIKADDPELLLKKGWILFEIDGDYETAENIFTLLIEKNPQNYTAALYRAWIYFRQEEFEKASVECDHLMEAAPDYYRSYYLKGSIFFRNNDLENAGKMFERGFSINKYDALSLWQASKIYLLKNDYKNALSLINKALKIEPANNSFLVTKSIVFAVRNKHFKARFFLKRAIRKNPDNYENYLLNVIYPSRKLTDEYWARRIIRKLFRNSIDRQISEAKKSLNNVAAGIPENSWQYWCAELILGNSDIEKALDENKIDADFLCEVFYFQAALLLASGNKIPAKEVFKKALDTDKSWHYTYILAQNEFLSLD